MRTCTAVVVAALALAVPAARAGEGPKPPAHPSHPAPDVIARLYLSEQPGDRASAERALDDAGPATLREVLDEVRRASDDFRIVPNARIPQEALDKGVGASVECRWVGLTPEQVGRLVPGGDRAAGESRIRILTPVHLARLLEALKAEPGADAMGFGGANTVDGYRTTSSQRTRVPYVERYDVRPDARGAWIADPVMGTTEDGADVVVTPRISPDRARIDLELKTRLRRMMRPIAVEKVALPGGAPPVDVQRPEIAESRWSRTASIPSGGTALVFMPDGYAGPGVRLMLLVTAKVIDLGTAPAARSKGEAAPVAPR